MRMFFKPWCVKLRQKSGKHTELQRELQMAGLWQSNEDAQRYEDSKNSYLGSKFIEWCFCKRLSFVILRIDQVEFSRFVARAHAFSLTVRIMLGWWGRNAE